MCGLWEFCILSLTGQSVFCRLWAVPAVTIPRWDQHPSLSMKKTSLMILLFAMMLGFRNTNARNWSGIVMPGESCASPLCPLPSILKMPAHLADPLPCSMGIARLLCLSTWSVGCWTTGIVLDASGEIIRRVKFQCLLFWFHWLT